MAVTVNYFVASPSIGSYLMGTTTPPTAYQAANTQKIAVAVGWLDADTQAVVTHNWGLGASAPTFFDPEVIAEIQFANAVGGTNMPVFTYGRSNTNVLTINKLAGAGSGGTAVFTLRRPFSASQ